MISKSQRYAVALEDLGHARVPDHRSRMYQVFARPDGTYYFVGPSGAVRRGKTIKSSFPVGDSFKNRLLEAYERNHGKAARKAVVL